MTVRMATTTTTAAAAAAAAAFAHSPPSSSSSSLASKTFAFLVVIEVNNRAIELLRRRTRGGGGGGGAGGGDDDDEPRDVVIGALRRAIAYAKMNMDAFPPGIIAAPGRPARQETPPPVLQQEEEEEKERHEQEGQQQQGHPVRVTHADIRDIGREGIDRGVVFEQTVARLLYGGPRRNAAGEIAERRGGGGEEKTDEEEGEAKTDSISGDDAEEAMCMVYELEEEEDDDDDVPGGPYISSVSLDHSVSHNVPSSSSRTWTSGGGSGGEGRGGGMFSFYDRAMVIAVCEGDAPICLGRAGADQIVAAALHYNLGVTYHRYGLRRRGRRPNGGGSSRHLPLLSAALRLYEISRDLISSALQRRVQEVQQQQRQQRRNVRDGSPEDDDDDYDAVDSYVADTDVILLALCNNTGYLYSRFFMHDEGARVCRSWILDKLEWLRRTGYIGSVEDDDFLLFSESVDLPPDDDNDPAAYFSGN